MLKVSKGNAKLKRTYTVSLLSGWSCPFARECLSKVVEDANGKRTVQDGPDTQFRCFSASQEATYPSTYNARKHNFELIKDTHTRGGVAAVAELIYVSLGSAMTKKERVKGSIVRPHVAGDFFAKWYFDAWLQVARMMPQHKFYFYTKATPFIVEARSNNRIPSNVAYTASMGGTRDDLIQLMGLRSARVVYSTEEASRRGLEIDKDDKLALSQGSDFALLLHGTQPKGSKAAEAKRKLAREGHTGYSKKRKAAA